ncbi:hypothetical protein EJB05_17174 [Eragrostis curvula]|uniref:Embryo surrounding factor 1 brassicaceae domain-containing protein n=1 Tax=Eragrostis curvula TaxID=38414 RepID=A0A5J9VJR1_9POAL|nr:hypothetical protein EJB05_17174 [Eragrostis curvula]
MAPRNSKIKVLLLVSLYTCLLFQGSSGLRCTYCNCLKFCKQLNPGYGQYCRQQCYQGKQCDFQCPPMEAPRMMADDGRVVPEMGVAVAAGGGGGDLGKVGDDGLGTPPLDLSPTFYCCYGRCFYLCSGGKITRDATSCHTKCVNKVCTISKLDAYDDLASHEMGLGKGNNGTETGGAAP